ncbi:MFS transporter [Stenotrophomonas maltophilia]|uniref:MFS transporter n=1 Tax=Stenotrophomonas maltophilia TaxID=40324 RepID=UPI003D7E177D
MAAGLGGVLIAAMVAGLNNRVPGLTMVDIQGALGFAKDDATWLTTAYTAGELAAMPFATWFAITLSLRRFHLMMLGSSMVLAAILPLISSFELVLVLRALQGMVSGALIPLLMMSALRFLPLPIRLHGLALYALTATFSPNVALWLGALWVDRLEDWRWAYWHVIPLGAVAAALVTWGIPKMPPALGRFKEGNWLGMALGIPGLALLVVGIDQGVRLDWLNSTTIRASLLAGLILVGLFLYTEWRHPAPFIKLQLLSRRNLGLGFSIFVFLLMAMTASVSVPVSVLASIQGFRLEQSYPLGLMVGVPQLILGPCVALLLYRKWIDARMTFSVGLMLIAAGLWSGSYVTSEWMVDQLVVAQILQMLGQPLAVISMLFLATSVVQPFEGAYVSGIVNTLRVIGTLLGGALVSNLTVVRGQHHRESLLSYAGQVGSNLPHEPAAGVLASQVAQQAGVLAAADIYRIFAVIAVALIPFVLCLKYIPAPVVPSGPAPAPAPAGPNPSTAVPSAPPAHG